MVSPGKRSLRFITWLSLILSGAAFLHGNVLAAGKPPQFWNLTSETVTLLQLAPAGTGHYGPNLCLNDKDKSVDHDERLKIPDLEAGLYDVKISAARGPACVVKGIRIEIGKVFSIEDRDLSNCQK